MIPPTESIGLFDIAWKCLQKTVLEIEKNCFFLELHLNKNRLPVEHDTLGLHIGVEVFFSLFVMNYYE